MTKENTTGLARAGGSRKKRYFVLTQHSLDYYRSIECLQKMGAIAINSLCSVTEPDEKTHKEEGRLQFTFTDHSSVDIQSNLSIATAQGKHKKWSLETGPFSICFNEKQLSRETRNVAFVDRWSV